MTAHGPPWASPRSGHAGRRSGWAASAMSSPAFDPLFTPLAVALSHRTGRHPRLRSCRCPAPARSPAPVPACRCPPSAGTPAGQHYARSRPDPRAVLRGSALAGRLRDFHRRTGVMPGPMSGPMSGRMSGPVSGPDLQPAPFRPAAALAALALPRADRAGRSGFPRLAVAQPIRGAGVLAPARRSEWPFGPQPQCLRPQLR